MKQITIAGKLGRDAETRAAGTDTVTSFSVAVDSREKQNGQWTKVTMWFDVSVWGKRGEAIAQYLTRGTGVCATGDFSIRSYQAKDGSMKQVPTVKASEVTLMGSKSDGQREQTQRRPQTIDGDRAGRANEFPADEFADDDIPF
jgi:single-strand DNA-binding protein